MPLGTDFPGAIFSGAIFSGAIFSGAPIDHQGDPVETPFAALGPEWRFQIELS
jgi:hypothetical protein